LSFRRNGKQRSAKRQKEGECANLFHHLSITDKVGTLFLKDRTT
jgi:hypothetical protein